MFHSPFILNSYAWVPNLDLGAKEKTLQNQLVGWVLGQVCIFVALVVSKIQLTPE